MNSRFCPDSDLVFYQFLEKTADRKFKKKSTMAIGVIENIKRDPHIFKMQYNAVETRHVFSLQYNAVKTRRTFLLQYNAVKSTPPKKPISVSGMYKKANMGIIVDAQNTNDKKTHVFCKVFP